jgi:hypothetical protein
LQSWNETSRTSFRIALIASDTSEVFVGAYDGSALPYESGSDDIEASGEDEPEGVIEPGACWLVQTPTTGTFFIETEAGWAPAAPSGAASVEPSDYEALRTEVEAASGVPNAEVVFAGLPPQDYPENGTLVSLTTNDESESGRDTITSPAESDDACDSVALGAGTPVDIVVLRGTSCEEAVSVAEEYDRSGIAPEPWSCFLGREGEPDVIACGYGGSSGAVQDFPHAFVGRHTG